MLIVINIKTIYLYVFLVMKTFEMYLPGYPNLNMFYNTFRPLPLCCSGSGNYNGDDNDDGSYI